MEAIRYAMIQSETVTNVILWNGDTTRWQPPADTLCIPAPDFVGVGWRYVDEQWLEPLPPPEPVVEIDAGSP